MYIETRPSVIAMGGRDTSTHTRDSSKSSLSGDPFFSNQPSGQRAPQIMGPREQTFTSRPPFNHKGTFGLSEPGKLPLKSTSGNQGSASHPIGPRDKSNGLLNPFQWSPEEARRQAKPTQSVPKASGSRNRGHKRSNVVRMSNLPRPPSVSMVPEEPEDNTPDKITGLVSSTTGLSTSNSQPDSPTSMYSRSASARPPSIKDFNPSFSVPEISVTSAQLAPKSEFPLPPYSSTLSIYNYYSSTELNASEDDFFDAHTSSNSPEPNHKSKRHARDFSFDGKTNFLSSHQLDQMQTADNGNKKDRASPTRAPTSPFDLPGPPPTKAMAPPSTRLHGPRSPPRKLPRDSLQVSIGMLRRMNSEVSTYSVASTVQSEGSPTLPDLRGGGISPKKEGRNRGSQHYLNAMHSFGSPSPRKRYGGSRETSKSPTRKRKSTKGDGSGLASDLPSFKIDSHDQMSPPNDRENALNIQGLDCKLPMDSWDNALHEESLDRLPALNSQSRWIDPSKPNNGQMPGPMGQIKWDSPHLEGPRMTTPIRESLGLYDLQGFLKNSPEKKKKAPE
jgi:hypothetical protein